MTTTLRYQPDLETASGIPADLLLLCLWSGLGLALTGLFFAMGFRVEIGLALMMAG
jgi:hypothetical protein